MNVSETDFGALDLSSGSRDRENMKSRSSVASHISHHSSSYQSEGKDFLKTLYFASTLGHLAYVKLHYSAQKLLRRASSLILFFVLISNPV